MANDIPVAMPLGPARTESLPCILAASASFMPFPARRRLGFRQGEAADRRVEDISFACGEGRGGR